MTPIINIERKACQKIDDAYGQIHRLEQQITDMRRQLQIADSRYRRLIKLQKKCFDEVMLTSNIIIYGAGDIGKFFTKK